MDRDKLAIVLKNQEKGVLLDLLLDGFDILSDSKKFNLFNPLYDKFNMPEYDSALIHVMVIRFYNESMDEKYYAPFELNSKTFMDVPDKTKLWFDMMAYHLSNSVLLYKNKDYLVAVKCFDKLFFLLENMCEEIVFAHELGTWMLSTKFSEIIPPYIESAFYACTEDDFNKRIEMLVRMNEPDFDKVRVLENVKGLVASPLPVNQSKHQ